MIVARAGSGFEPLGRLPADFAKTGDRFCAGCAADFDEERQAGPKGEWQGYKTVTGFFEIVTADQHMKLVGLGLRPTSLPGCTARCYLVECS